MSSARGQRRFFGDPTPIQKNYLVSDYRSDIGDLPVRKSVHIQVGAAPDQSVAETLWVDAEAGAHGLPSALIAFCDLRRPDAAAELNRHAAAGRFRGVRQIVSRSAAEDAGGGANLLTDPAFAEGLELLASRGLVFDLQLTPPHLIAAAELLSRRPELPVALCHAGSLSDFSKAGRAEWRAGIAALSRLPNVICKLSGFGMFDPSWSAASIRDQACAAIDSFSPKRIAFGSNFPVDRLYASYAQTWEAYFEIALAYGRDERQSMFFETAACFYGLHETP